MDDEGLQRTAYRLAVSRGLLREDTLTGESITAAVNPSDCLRTYVEAGALDPAAAHQLEEEAALASTEEDSQFTGLFPLRHTERYQPELYLGDGGMGRVFRVYDTLLKRRVALKFFRTSLPQEVKVFEREAQSQARIDHPNVARIFEAGELEGFPFLSMQFIQGPTLAAAASGLDLRLRVEMVRQACLGVHSAHRLGIVHRDVKPGNIMLEQDEQGAWKAFVLDFGLARDLSDPSLLPSTTVMGTPAFMAPEQVLGPAVLVGPHTDVYALGVTLYQVLTGELPFRGNNHAVMFRKIVEEDAPPLRTWDPTLPAELEAIVQHCMEKDIFRRYDSALDLAEDLERFLDGKPVTARPLPRWRRWAKRVRRNSVAFLAAGFALILAGGWLAYALWSRAQVTAMQGRITAQGEDLSRALQELGHLKEAQQAERALTQALQLQVAQARTPDERQQAEVRLQQSREREQALALQVAKAEQRPTLASPPAKLETVTPESTPAKPMAPPAATDPEPPPVAPQMLRQAPLNYPFRARSSSLNPHLGSDVSVLVAVQLDANGQVQEARVDAGVPGQWGYDEAALAAVRASTFAPAQRAGRPVAGTLHVRVTFPKLR